MTYFEDCDSGCVRLPPDSAGASLTAWAALVVSGGRRRWHTLPAVSAHICLPLLASVLIDRLEDSRLLPIVVAFVYFLESTPTPVAHLALLIGANT